MSDFAYVPLEAKGWRMAMGLRPLDFDRWLEVDARRDDELAQKRQLLDVDYDVVVATNPAGDEGSHELARRGHELSRGRIIPTIARDRLGRRAPHRGGSSTGPRGPVRTRAH